MAFSKDKEFKYSFRGLNKVIEERGNQFTRLAQIAWVGEDEEVEPDKIKLDLRKYTTDQEGNERMLKGISFLTEEGPHELANVLVEEGYGNTERIIRAINTRSDFNDSVKLAYGDKVSEDSDGTFDLRDIL